MTVGRRVWQTVLRHQLLAVFLVALLLRLAVAGAIVALTDHYIAPDEGGYMLIASLAARGQLHHSLEHGYLLTLFRETAAFSVLLTVLLKVFWPARFFGQVIAAGFGAATAVLVVRLGRDLVPTRWATLAGVAVAVLPSQVLWSALVLRESMVWAALAGLAVIAATLADAESVRRVVLLTIAAGSLLCILGWLRDQTLVVAALALPLALMLVPANRLVAVIGAAVATLVVTLAFGLGPGGTRYIYDEAKNLSTRRYELAEGAASSFVQTTTTVATAPAGTSLPVGQIGTSRPVDQTGTSHALGRGLIAFLFRPWPWESAGGTSLRLAAAENLAWYAIYAFAVVGVWTLRNRRRVVAFPAIVAVGVILTAALSEGNLGTAFRHRGQVAWALMLFAVVGMHTLVTRRRAVAHGVDVGAREAGG